MADQGADIAATNNGIIRIENDKGRLIVKGQGVDIMLAGLDNSGQPVMKIAKPGIDVKTATDDQLVFNSLQNVFKIVKKDVVTLPYAADGATSSVQVAHRLGKAPIVLAFIKSDIYSSQLPFSLIASSGANAGKVLQQVTCQCDDTNIYFYNQSQLQGTAGYTITYYVLQETAI